MSVAPQAVLQPRFQNVLFATDFSLCSKVAAPYARALALRYNSSIHVLHVLAPKPLLIGGELSGEGVSLEGESEQIASTRMDGFLKFANFEDVLYTRTLETGSVGNIVEKLINDLRIDLIIIGTHGRSGLQHLLLGSVAESILRRAACPVLTIGPKTRRNGLASGSVHAILYATDLSPSSAHAFDYAAFLARTNDARVWLVHSTKKEHPDCKSAEQIEDVQNRLSALGTNAVLSYGVVVGSRPPAQVILGASRDIKSDIIVMGAHTGQIASTHASSVAHQVIREAWCPVLTIRS